MNDPTETDRRQRLAQINIEPGSRQALESEYGQVWDTKELAEDFGNDRSTEKPQDHQRHVMISRRNRRSSEQ